MLWTVDHVSRFNLGMVAGKKQLAVLEKRDGQWIAHHEDAGEGMQQVKDPRGCISLGSARWWLIHPPMPPIRLPPWMSTPSR